MTTIQVPGLLTVTIAILVFFVGSLLNRSIPALGRFNIPEAVSGGLLAALCTLALYSMMSTEIIFSLGARDMLLLYFFTGIGLNARFADLVRGGRPLVILLALTLAFLLIQNAIALTGAALFGLPDGLAIFLGSASLIGGHGTTIAWAPLVQERFGVTNALEIGIASATLGLVIASLIGGPLAHHLIKRHGLKGPDKEELTVGVPADAGARHADDVSYHSLLQTLFVMNLAILAGYALHELVDDIGIRLPLFVMCLLCAIAMTNLVPLVAPRLPWPSGSRALSLISDLSLSVFLAMSLMSMQLWALGGLGIALVAILFLQTAATIIYILFAVFPAMGRNYVAAVISAGFGGVTLGATPTAIANMAAITKSHGAAPMAFIIVPLVSAFFIDLANAAVIGFMLR